MYVDDMITGECVKDEVLNLKETAVTVFGTAKFTLHKWHSNEPQLDSDGDPKDDQQSYAKQQLGVQQGETKMLGLSWNKRNDTLAVTFPEKPAEVTKREILRFLASVYDPLGLVSPVTLVGKMLYRAVCDRHLPWDEKVSDNIALQWHKFMSSLPNKVDVVRSLPFFKEQIKAVILHVFGDASAAGVSAAVYAVIHQASGTSQGLVAASSRLAKKNLTIPRLELVSAHMAANLVDNVRKALEGYPVNQVQGWLDSTVALCWIKRRGSYKQFVGNRVLKINEKDFIEWRHVGTDQNPADLGSRGCKADQLSGVWLEGPEWLSNAGNWPEDIVPGPNKETEEEAKKIKEVFTTAVEAKDDYAEILEKHSFWRAVRITAWISRFVHNCRNKKSIETVS
ncbi:hypothetical protein QZH41_002078 [Actinostola sp. cb2023]|nr:hypothetical protein QZH41_002078 [Actinostola sp. cb2023]